MLCVVVDSFTMIMGVFNCVFFFFKEEEGKRWPQGFGGLGNVYKGQPKKEGGGGHPPPSLTISICENFGPF